MRITFRFNRYPQEAIQNSGNGVDTTPVVTTILQFGRNWARGVGGIQTTRNVKGIYSPVTSVVRPLS